MVFCIINRNVVFANEEMWVCKNPSLGGVADVLLVKPTNCKSWLWALSAFHIVCCALCSEHMMDNRKTKHGWNTSRLKSISSNTLMVIIATSNEIYVIRGTELHRTPPAIDRTTRGDGFSDQHWVSIRGEGKTAFARNKFDPETAARLRILRERGLHRKQHNLSTDRWLFHPEVLAGGNISYGEHKLKQDSKCFRKWWNTKMLLLLDFYNFLCAPLDNEFWRNFWNRMTSFAW